MHPRNRGRTQCPVLEVRERPYHAVNVLLPGGRERHRHAMGVVYGELCRPQAHRLRIAHEQAPPLALQPAKAPHGLQRVRGARP